MGKILEFPKAIFSYSDGDGGAGMRLWPSLLLDGELGRMAAIWLSSKCLHHQGMGCHGALTSVIDQRVERAK
jgi:hypothetical protein